MVLIGLMSVLTRKIKIAIGAVFCCLALFFAVGATLVWAQTFEGRMGPNTYIGSINVSGLSTETVRELLQDVTDSFYATGAPILLDGKPSILPLSIMIGTDAIEILTFEVENTIEVAYDLTHSDNAFVESWMLLQSLTQDNRMGMFISGDDQKIFETIRETFPDRETLAVQATFSSSQTADGWKIKVTEGAAGDEFDTEKFSTELIAHLGDLVRIPTTLNIVHRTPDVTMEVASSFVSQAEGVLNRGAITLIAKQNGVDVKSFVISSDELALMLVPSTTRLELDETLLNVWIEKMATDVEITAQDALFSVTDGRVTQFVSSASGRSLSRETVREDLYASINGEVTTIDVLLTTTEPETTTDEVNDLGITQVLGTGISRYRGSPTNRIKNIRNGVALLNGRLIAPGETFSLLNALKPFELENGYFSELVIKGDEIKPEIGGGLCQIGTTTFRAAMMSGLPIEKRSNHSLVVSYYNDLANGNPGTDATIYDPAPDFSFTNDTGHYVLFEAIMLDESQELQFTFWGTSDGRKGSYSPPEVIRWIGVADPIKTETLELEPGVEKCQSAHVGADTQFTYSVVKADGTVNERLFESHYRPLPEICLVGVLELSTPEDLQLDTEGVSSLQTTDTLVDDEALQSESE